MDLYHKLILIFMISGAYGKNSLSKKKQAIYQIQGSIKAFNVNKTRKNKHMEKIVEVQID